MELHELHVEELGAGPVGHGDPVPRGDVGVGRLAEHAPGPAGGQDRGPGRDQLQALAVVPDQGALALALVGDQVDREGVLEEANPRVGPGALEERALNLVPGRVARRVEDPSRAVAPLLGPSKVALPVAVEAGPARDQLPDPRGGLADHELDDLGIAEVDPGHVGVLGVALVAVVGHVWIEHDRDPALGPVGVALRRLGLGHDQDAVRLRGLEGGGEPRDPAPEDQDPRPTQGELAGVEGD